MKIECVNAEETFKPVNILLTIETKEEFDAIGTMTWYDSIIPNAVHPDSNSRKYKIVKSFLNNLRYALCK